MRDSKQVCNPLLCLPAAHRLQQLPPDARQALKTLLLELRREAADKAQAAWLRNKGMTAAYWKAVSIYAGHAARLCRDPHPGVSQRRSTGETGSHPRGREARETRDGLKGRERGFRPPVLEKPT